MDKKNINRYIEMFCKPKINKINLVAEVLSRFQYGELQTIQKRTPRMFQSLYKVPYLKRSSISDIFSIGKILWDNTVDVYGALTFVILNNAKEINHYVKLRRQLDYATAVMHYDEAYRLLDQIGQEVSVSITGMIYMLKLTRLDKGITASTQLHNSLCKENSILSYISGVALKSASIDLPFEGEIEGLYHALHGEEDIQDFFTAFAFPYKQTKSESWLNLLLFSSIIDIYEGLLLQLNSITPQRLKEDALKNMVMDLAHNINDVRIQRLGSLLNKGEIFASEYVFSEEREIIECYYNGKYTEVVSKGKEYLIKHPLESTILDLYNRSCIKLDIMPEDLFPRDSLANRVHCLSYFASTNIDGSEVCRTQLRNVCMAWYSIPGMKHLYHLFYDMEQVRRGSVYYRFWCDSLVPEIRDATFFETIDETLTYLQTSGYNIDRCAQAKILEQQYNDDYNQTYSLLYDYPESELIDYKNKLENLSIAPILVGSIASQLFDRLLQASQFAEAISLLVNLLIDKPYVKIHIDRQLIVKTLTDAEDEKLPDQLELAIFYTMINADVYKRYLAYKRFLKNIKCRKASDIKAAGNDKLQFFIGKVADRNVLTLHIKEFETEDDVDTERIELCKNMFSITNDKGYADEITSLIKEHEVRALAQQVNDSKIHVDVQSLINSEFDTEKLMFDTYSEIDENLEMFEQKNIEGFVEFLKQQYEGKTVYVKFELPTVKYKRILFRQMVLNIRDKFLFDPRYGLDKYLSARIRHGTLITQLRNHFLSHFLVTNKKEGGEYSKISHWTQMRMVNLPETTKEKINSRLLSFTEWLDEQLRIVKEVKIQINTERNEGKDGGLFDYSEEHMADIIDKLEDAGYESFDALVHTAIGILWTWTGKVLQDVRAYFQEYQETVLNEMTNLQNDVVALMAASPTLANSFKDAITSCRTEFQADISVVSSWFKPEKSKVRFFTIQQAVDTSLSVINKINQNALSFSSVIINDTCNYNGEYFNAFHDVFHDMMNNILGYETKRPTLKGKGRIFIDNIDGILHIEVSNPIDSNDLDSIQKILEEQKNFPQLIAGGKTRKEVNSGCVKIYSTVMYTLGNGNKYENKVENDCFIARLHIDTKNLKYDENTIS
jgi:hypothetical protein